MDGWLGGPSLGGGAKIGRSLSDRQDVGADMHDAEDHGVFAFQYMLHSPCLKIAWIDACRLQLVGQAPMAFLLCCHQLQLIAMSRVVLFLFSSGHANDCR